MTTRFTESIGDSAAPAWLAVLRDALLPKRISVEVRVPDAERFVGAVA